MSSITWRPEEKEDVARRSATPLLDRKEHSKIPFGKNKHMDYTTFAILTLSGFTACAESINMMMSESGSRGRNYRSHARPDGRAGDLTASALSDHPRNCPLYTRRIANLTRPHEPDANHEEI
jgi:hypothetical protein